MSRSVASLTPRQCEALIMARDGFGNKQIARRFGISEQTVKAHMTTIHRILAVRTRTQAVVQAIKQGLIPLE